MKQTAKVVKIKMKKINKTNKFQIFILKLNQNILTTSEVKK